MYTLKPTEYDRIRPLFAGLVNRVAIEATLAGTTDGRIYVDDPIRPSAAFFWNDYRYSYLAGNPADGAFVASLRALLVDDLLPAALESHDPTVVIYPASRDWEAHLPALLAGCWHVPLLRRTFAFDAAAFAARPVTPLPDGLTLCDIDATMIAAAPDLRAEIEMLWTSPDAFLTHGFGVCVLDGDRVVSACLSAFAGGDLREISVNTQPDYRRQGLALATAGAFIERCMTHDLTPVWECWHDNAPSVKLAEKLGFYMLEDYPVIYLDATRQPESLTQKETNVG